MTRNPEDGLRVVEAVDAWLGQLTDPANLEATVASIADGDDNAETEPSEVTQARHQLRRLEVELDRLLAAIRAGMDPALAAGATRQVQAEMHRAESTMAEWEGSQARVAPLDDRQIRAAIAHTIPRSGADDGRQKLSDMQA